MGSMSLKMATAPYMACVGKEMAASEKERMPVRQLTVSARRGLGSMAQMITAKLWQAIT